MNFNRIKFEPFEHLFQHIKQTDVRLYESLKKIVNLLGLYADTVNSAEETIENSVVPRYKRTLLLKDLTVGNDIADRVTVYKDGEFKRITATLRVPITADLQVRVNINSKKLGVRVLGVITIPLATLVDDVVTLVVEGPARDGEVLSWDVLASSGAKDKAGIASVNAEWD